MIIIKRILLCMLVILLTGLAVSEMSEAQTAEKEASFYKGKLITFIVPYSPGGGYDAYARMIAPYLEKYTGATVIVKNVPGGGTLTGTLQMYRAKPDGLTLSIVQLSSLIARALLGESLGFDLNKFSWLARVASENRLVVSGAKSGYRAIEDMLKASKQIKFSAAGVLSSDFNHIALFAEALNLNVRLITAYEGSNEQDLAVVRGDVEATLGSYTSKLKFIKSGDMIPIVQFGETRDKEISSIPLGTELPNLQPNDRAMLSFVNQQAAFDRVLAAPPGIGPSRLQFLREVVMKALNDPELISIGEKQRRPIIPADDRAVERAVKHDLQMPQNDKELMKQAINKHKG